MRTSMTHERTIRMVEAMRRVLMLSNDRSSSFLVPVSIFRKACLDLIWYPEIEIIVKLKKN